MPGRRKDLRPKSGRDAPGAGAYNPKLSSTRRSDPSFSVSKAPRDPSLNQYGNTPGATSYQVNDGLVRTHSANWRIGSEHRPK